MSDQTITIGPGQHGADYVRLEAPHTPQWLRAHGFTFVCRYITRSPGANAAHKELTAAEIAELHAGGIAIVLNYERSKLDAKGGDAAGRAHGAEAVAAARTFGYPTGLHIVVSVDNEVESHDTTTMVNAGTEVEHAKAVAYVNAFVATVRAGGYTPGIYGDGLLLELCGAPDTLGWLTASSGWSPGVTGFTVHVHQGSEDKVDGIDPNVCVTAFDAWLPVAGDPPTVAPVAIAVPKPTLNDKTAAHDPEVMALQRLLNEHGWGDCGHPNGTFGDRTKQAVMAMQQVLGVKPDGDYGKVTAAALAACSRSRAWS